VRNSNDGKMTARFDGRESHLSEKNYQKEIDSNKKNVK
jgi:hypothetical protein